MNRDRCPIGRIALDWGRGEGEPPSPDPDSRRSGEPMNDKNRPRPPQGGRPPIQRRPPQPRGASSEELMEMADALEEQAREILRHAKHLQRLASTLDQSERRPPFRPARTERPAARSGEEGGERPASRGGGGGGERPPSRGGSGGERPKGRGGSGGDRPPPRRSSSAPPWAPKGKRKRPEK